MPRKKWSERKGSRGRKWRRGGEGRGDKSRGGGGGRRWRGLRSLLTGHPAQRTVCAACRETTNRWKRWREAPPPRSPAPSQPPQSTHLYRGCSEVSEGDRSGMERDVEDRVVAMEAVVASSKEGGVQGRRSGRPVGSRGWALVGARPLPLLP